MSLGELALCFASGCLGAVVGVKLLFLLATPRAKIDLTLKLKGDPKCPGCGMELGAKHLLAEQEASDEFDVTMRQ